MKKIDFEQMGGMPLKQPTLGFMQDSYDELSRAFLDWAARKGDLRESVGSGGVILTGIERTTEGGVEKYTPGWILRDGELLRFGGANVTDVEDGLGIGTQTVTTQATFKDGTQKPVYTHKLAVPGGDNPLPLAMFSRSVNLADCRPVLARTLTNHVPAVAPGALVTINFNIIGAREGDVAVATVSPALNNGLLPAYGISDWVFVQSRVPADGQIQVTLLNMHKTQPAFDGLVEFKIRILK